MCYVNREIEPCGTPINAINDSMTTMKKLPSIQGVGLVLALCVVLGAVSCGRQESSEPLARVGEEAITLEDLKAEIAHRREQNRSIPSKEALIEEMVEAEALLQRAREEGLREDPAVRREIRNLLIGALKEKALLPRLKEVEVTDAEVEAEYEASLDLYRKPGMTRLAILFLEGSPGMSQEKREELTNRLKEARDRVISNPPPGGRGPAANGFGKLAIRYSEDQSSRYRGGDIGWLETGRFSYPWPRPVLEAGYSLEEGEVSPVIASEDGLYLVMKTDSREASVTPFSEVEEAIRDRLRTRRRRELREAFLESTRRNARIEVNRDYLASIDVPEASNATATNRQGVPPGLPGKEADTTRSVE